MATSETRVTRGKLLKRAGVGAAMLGAGSMLTASTAGAGLATTKACVGAGGCGCFGGGGCVPIAGGSGCCYCFTNTEGCCIATENVFCAGLATCTSSSQCPPGWGCIANTGCGAGVCAPHCGANSPHNFCIDGGPARVSGGRKASDVG